jgi:hypothetical protein
MRVLFHLSSVSLLLGALAVLAAVASGHEPPPGRTVVGGGNDRDHDRSGRGLFKVVDPYRLQGDAASSASSSSYVEAVSRRRIRARKRRRPSARQRRKERAGVARGVG